MALKARYEQLSTDRSQFLQRARHNALLTLPSLMPLEGQTGASHLVEPYQGLGARGVVHLSSRMLVGFLPAGRPYMRLDLPPEIKLAAQGEEDTATTKGLALSERLVQGEVEASGWRESTLMTLQQLLVAGSAVEQMLDDNKIRVFRLDQFVVRRNHDGTILELIIQEKFKRDATPVELTNPKANGGTTTMAPNQDEEVELYSGMKMITEGSRRFYRRTQEWGDGQAASESTTWELKDFPYLALRWSATPGEDYGRSKVEEHIGDLRSLDALEKAQLEMAAMAARNFVMIAPGAGAAGMKNRLARAINGDVVVGDPDSVELKSFDNQSGYQLTAQQVQILRENLAQAFLLSSAGQRNAERVTAKEIERDIQELESSLGGQFSTLSLEMMQRRTQLLIGNMKVQQKLPPFPDGTVNPVILTGLEALSRERDVVRAQQAGEVVRQFLGADESARHVVKLDKILGRALVGLGFEDAVRTEDEATALRAQEQQQQQQQELINATAPGVAKELASKQGGQ